MNLLVKEDRMRLLRIIYYKINRMILNLSHRDIYINKNAKIKKIKFLNGPCKIGENTYINGRIGRFTYIGKNCNINGDIGKFCSISDNVKIIDSFHPLDWVSMSPCFYSNEKQCGVSFVRNKKIEDHLFIDDSKSLTCSIGNDVWIGTNVLIKGGIKIGNGACIAMGAVVTKDVPDYAVVAGVPARVIRYRFSEDDIKVLNNIKWWNESEDWLRKNADIFESLDKFKKEFES